MFQKAEYIKSLEHHMDAPDTLPQVLIMGRSNVGKSSFINGLTNRKNLARTSSTPGKTLLLNFYKIDESFYLVDAPGYGYAKRAKTMSAKFLQMIVHFINESKPLKGIIALIDFKVGPTNLDLEWIANVKHSGLKVSVIATKVDQIPKTKRKKQQQQIERKLGMSIIPISNTERLNLETVETLFESILNEGNESM